ncbi:MAG: DUF2911 domain-containing protein [Saprospiraceae bacterium]|nr:DUF2911 domain-containing protein [Saprospiraceae bacterium]
MNKTLKRILIGVGILAIIFFVGSRILINQTKKASPEDLVEYIDGDKKIEVFYCQPGKRDRQIFGGLVPYGKVWRTGANEASTFEVSQDINVGGKKLPAGKYTLWTIPNPDQWTVIFNKKMYGWGVNFSEEALREPEQDALTIQVPVEKTTSVTELFTIEIDTNRTLGMSLAWDDIIVRVPLAW